MSPNLASIVHCPNCNHFFTRIYCGHYEGNIKVRYRSCPECDHRFITTQQQKPTVEREQLLRQRTRKPPRNTKLQIHEIAMIKKFLANGTYTNKELAIQYQVTASHISKIKIGRFWANVEPAL